MNKEPKPDIVKEGVIIDETFSQHDPINEPTLSKEERYKIAMNTFNDSLFNVSVARAKSMDLDKDIEKATINALKAIRKKRTSKL